jgi:hypothetical protein
MSTSTSSNSSASDMRGFIDKNASKSDPLCGMAVFDIERKVEQYEALGLRAYYAWWGDCSALTDG